MIDELKLSEAHAEAIIQKAIDFEVYTDEMPDTKKNKMEAAHEIVAFAIDSWVSDGMRPDSEDEGEAKAGQMIEEIFEIAGVEVDDDDEVVYNEPPEIVDGDADDDNDDDDEAAVDIDDIIDGYEELSAGTRLKKIKALKLDPEDDDDYNTLVAIAEWEEAQDKPASRVLDYLNDVIPPDEDDDNGDDDDETADDAGDDDADGDEDGDGEDEPYTEEDLLEMEKDDLAEVAEEFDVDFPSRLTAAGKKKVVAAILEAQGDGDDEEPEEPWEGYDDSSVKDIIEVVEDDERTVEELQYVLEYENSLDKPRAKIVKSIEKAIEALSDDDNDGDSDDDDEPEEKSARKGRRGKAKTEDPDDADDADEAKARDDRKDAKKGKGGKLILTRDQIIEALTKGEITVTIG